MIYQASQLKPQLQEAHHQQLQEQVHHIQAQDHLLLVLHKPVLEGAQIRQVRNLVKAVAVANLAKEEVNSPAVVDQQEVNSPVVGDKQEVNSLAVGVQQEVKAGQEVSSPAEAVKAKVNKVVAARAKKAQGAKVKISRKEIRAVDQLDASKNLNLSSLLAVLQVGEVEAELKVLQMVEVKVEAQALKMEVVVEIKMASKDLAEIKVVNRDKIKGRVRADRAIRIKNVNPAVKKVLVTNNIQNSLHQLIAL